MGDQHARDERIAADFAVKGFAIVTGLANAAELREVRSIYDGIIDGSIPCPGFDRRLGGLTQQVLMPQLHHPTFASNPILDNARELAKRLLQIDEPEFVFSMLIYKPPHHPYATPWHQDLAYSAMPFAPAGMHLPNDTVVQFWLALDAVDETMGCMEFAPGQQVETLLPHHVVDGSPDSDERLLAIDDPERHLDFSRTAICPLAAGSATVHGYTTSHYTGPNRSDRGRRAYIFSFSNPAKMERAKAELARAAWTLPQGGR